ncbi:MAG TPA: hypothetical protein DHW49_03490 [Anaerolineae bacterium]|nr:hypothetical protein [Anaerolineae bacterium]
MNTKILLACSLITYFLVGCISFNNPTHTSVVSTSTPQSTTSPTLFIKPTITLTSTFIAPTFEAIPTLGTDESFSSLRNYLKNEPPCQLPCLLGIRPGQSTFLEVKKILAEFSGISNDLYFKQVTDIWVVGILGVDINEGNSVIGFRSHFVTKIDKDVILYTGFRAYPDNYREGNTYADEDHNNLLFAYTLPQIVQTYGLPTQTLMTADLNVSEPTSPDDFIIRVLYPELGIFIKYDMPMEIKENTYKFCVSEAIIDLTIISEEYRHNYQEFFKETNDEWEWVTSAKSISISNPFLKSTKDAIKLDDEDFYDKLISSPNQCFESPINIWPEP